MFLPRTCPGCTRLGPAPCVSCLDALTPPPDDGPPPGLDRCVALFGYEGVGADLVRRLKYANHRDAVPTLAAALASLVIAERPDVVCWVPTSRRRVRDRGFDQSELLARSVARHVGCRSVRLLARARGDSRSAPQSSLDRTGRLVGPSLRATRSVTGTVVVVDDVRTTGASLAAAAAQLRAAGARRVIGATLAATPSRSGAGASTIESIS